LLNSRALDSLTSSPKGECSRAKTGATTPIAYPEVGIKVNNLSTGVKIGIGIAIAAAVAVVAAIIASSSDDERQNGQIICVTAPCP
jgi:hypothetical protein